MKRSIQDARKSWTLLRRNRWGQDAVHISIPCDNAQDIGLLFDNNQNPRAGRLGLGRSHTEPAMPQRLRPPLTLPTSRPATNSAARAKTEFVLTPIALRTQGCHPSPTRYLTDLGSLLLLTVFRSGRDQHVSQKVQMA